MSLRPLKCHQRHNQHRQQQLESDTINEGPSSPAASGLDHLVESVAEAAEPRGSAREPCSPRLAPSGGGGVGRVGQASGNDELTDNGGGSAAGSGLNREEEAVKKREQEKEDRPPPTSKSKSISKARRRRPCQVCRYTTTSVGLRSSRCPRSSRRRQCGCLARVALRVAPSSCCRASSASSGHHHQQQHQQIDLSLAPPASGQAVESQTEHNAKQQGAIEERGRPRRHWRRRDHNEHHTRGHPSGARSRESSLETTTSCQQTSPSHTTSSSSPASSTSSTSSRSSGSSSSSSSPTEATSATSASSLTSSSASSASASSSSSLTFDKCTSETFNSCELASTSAAFDNDLNWRRTSSHYQRRSCSSCSCDLRSSSTSPVNRAALSNTTTTFASTDTAATTTTTTTTPVTGSSRGSSRNSLAPDRANTKGDAEIEDPLAPLSGRLRLARSSRERLRKHRKRRHRRRHQFRLGRAVHQERCEHSMQKRNHRHHQNHRNCATGLKVAAMAADSGQQSESAAATFRREACHDRRRRPSVSLEQLNDDPNSNNNNSNNRTRQYLSMSHSYASIAKESMGQLDGPDVFRRAQCRRHKTRSPPDGSLVAVATTATTAATVASSRSPPKPIGDNRHTTSPPDDDDDDDDDDEEEDDISIGSDIGKPATDRFYCEHRRRRRRQKRGRRRSVSVDEGRKRIEQLLQDEPLGGVLSSMGLGGPCERTDSAPLVVEPTTTTTNTATLAIATFTTTTTTTATTTTTTSEVHQFRASVRNSRHPNDNDKSSLFACPSGDGPNGDDDDDDDEDDDSQQQTAFVRSQLRRPTSFNAMANVVGQQLAGWDAAKLAAEAAGPMLAPSSIANKFQPRRVDERLPAAPIARAAQVDISAGGASPLSSRSLGGGASSSSSTGPGAKPSAQLGPANVASSANSFALRSDQPERDVNHSNATCTLSPPPPLPLASRKRPDGREVAAPSILDDKTRARDRTVRHHQSYWSMHELLDDRDNSGSGRNNNYNISNNNNYDNSKDNLGRKAGWHRQIYRSNEFLTVEANCARPSQGSTIVSGLLQQRKQPPRTDDANRLKETRLPAAVGEQLERNGRQATLVLEETTKTKTTTTTVSQTPVFGDTTITTNMSVIQSRSKSTETGTGAGAGTRPSSPPDSPTIHRNQLQSYYRHELQCWQSRGASAAAAAAGATGASSNQTNDQSTTTTTATPTRKSGQKSSKMTTATTCKTANQSQDNEDEDAEQQDAELVQLAEHLAEFAQRLGCVHCQCRHQLLMLVRNEQILNLLTERIRQGGLSGEPGDEEGGGGRDGVVGETARGGGVGLNQSLHAGRQAKSGGAGSGHGERHKRGHRHGRRRQPATEGAGRGGASNDQGERDRVTKPIVAQDRRVLARSDDESGGQSWSPSLHSLSSSSSTSSSKSSNSSSSSSDSSTSSSSSSSLSSSPSSSPSSSSASSSSQSARLFNEERRAPSGSGAADSDGECAGSDQEQPEVDQEEEEAANEELNALRRPLLEGGCVILDRSGRGADDEPVVVGAATGRLRTEGGAAAGADSDSSGDSDTFSTTAHKNKPQRQHEPRTPPPTSFATCNETQVPAQPGSLLDLAAIGGRRGPRNDGGCSRRNATSSSSSELSSLFQVDGPGTASVGAPVTKMKQTKQPPLTTAPMSGTTTTSRSTNREWQQDDQYGGPRLSQQGFALVGATGRPRLIASGSARDVSTVPGPASQTKTTPANPESGSSSGAVVTGGAGAPAATGGAQAGGLQHLKQRQRRLAVSGASADRVSLQQQRSSFGEDNSNDQAQQEQAPAVCGGGGSSQGQSQVKNRTTFGLLLGTRRLVGAGSQLAIFDGGANPEESSGGRFAGSSASSRKQALQFHRLHMNNPNLIKRRQFCANSSRSTQADSLSFSQDTNNRQQQQTISHSTTSAAFAAARGFRRQATAFDMSQTMSETAGPKGAGKKKSDSSSFDCSSSVSCSFQSQPNTYSPIRGGGGVVGDTRRGLAELGANRRRWALISASGSATSSVGAAGAPQYLDTAGSTECDHQPEVIGGSSGGAWDFHTVHRSAVARLDGPESPVGQARRHDPPAMMATPPPPVALSTGSGTTNNTLVRSHSDLELYFSLLDKQDQSPSFR